jgi:hypothetical protein
MRLLLKTTCCIVSLVYNLDGRATGADTSNHIIQFIFTSDVHYGITRKQFRGDTNVDASVVNKAMIAQINALPKQNFPDDKGVNAGKPIRYIDHLALTGDIANRQEPPSQSATLSWKQFTDDYFHTVTTKAQSGRPTELFLMPGNHDASNAIGSYREMKPATDPASMVGIYNSMIHPYVPKTNASYNYTIDKINYSRDISGVHFVFMNIWPDSATRTWLTKDLARVSSTTPVILFGHDPPEVDKAHLTNPNGAHDINATDKFDNLLPEQFKDANTANPQNTILEQVGLVGFLKLHPNIKAWFHGHNNYTQFYTYKGPDNDISLPVFRSDSPMKGRYSGADETKLAFQLITLDTRTKELTARECLWNTDPSNPSKPIVWGSSITVLLK